MKLDPAKLAELIDSKMKEGMTLEEAINHIGTVELTKLTQPAKPRIADRISYIKGLNDVQELRRASKSAFAKRAKAKDDETDARYGEEIFAVRDRLCEINEIIANAEKPLAKALEFGESQEGIVQRALDLFPDVDKRLTRHLKRLGITKKAAKAKLQRASTEVPEEVVKLFKELDPSEPNPYVEIFRRRLERKDQRVLALTRILNFMSSKRSQ